MKVVVTGASGGIGTAVAKLFVEKGHQVIGLDLVKSSFAADNYRHYICDVAKAQSLPELENVEVLPLRYVWLS